MTMAIRKVARVKNRILTLTVVSAVLCSMTGNLLFAAELSATGKEATRKRDQSITDAAVAGRQSSLKTMDKGAAEIDTVLNPIEVSLSVDLASAYVFRGSTFNDGAVLQPGIEIGGLPISLGVWANADIGDYDGALTDGEFSEIDFYGSYTLPIPSDVLEVSLGYCEYTYPGAESDADREVSLSFSLAVPLSPSLAVNQGVDGGIDKTTYVEAGISHGFDVERVSVELSAAVGYVSPDEGESGVSHLDASISLSYGVVSLSVTSVSQIDEDVLPDVEDEGSYDVGVYGMIGLASTF